MAKFTSDTARQMGQRGGLATVRKHYGGDYRLAINTLIARGLMALDPVTQNGAWTKARIPNRLPADYAPPAEDATSIRERAAFYCY